MFNEIAKDLQGFFNKRCEKHISREFRELYDKYGLENVVDQIQTYRLSSGC